MFSFLITPRGPSLSNAEELALEFSGTRVLFRAPSYSYHRIGQSGSEGRREHDRLPMQYDLSDFSLYGSLLDRHFDESPYDPQTDMAGFVAFNTAWRFKRPPLGTKYDGGTLRLAVSVSHMPQYGSLFKPKNFERSVVRYLELRYGPEGFLNEDSDRYRVPVAWSVQRISGQEWLHCIAEEPLVGNSRTLLWFTPLTEEHAIRFSFETGGHCSDKLEEIFDKFSAQVVGTCTIDYSPESQSSIAKAKAEGFGEPINAHRKLFTWSAEPASAAA